MNSITPVSTSSSISFHPQFSGLWNTIQEVSHRFFETTLQSRPYKSITWLTERSATLGQSFTNPVNLFFPLEKTEWGKTIKIKMMGFITDCFVLPHLTTLFPLAFISDQTGRIGYDKNTLIVPIHGFSHNGSWGEHVVKDLITQTAKTEYELTAQDFYCPNLSRGPITTCSIDTYASYMAIQLEKIRKERALERMKVIFISHSMGGLVAGQFATKYANDIGVDVILLISNGTPWAGTPLASTAPWVPCVQEMIPQSNFLKELNQRMSALHQRVWCISSRADTIVPYRSALGEQFSIDPTHRITLQDNWGHIGMIHSEERRRKVTELVLNTLAS